MDSTYEHTFIPLTTVSSGEGKEVNIDIYCYCIQFVNICLIGNPTSKTKTWFLVDAGMPHSADNIIRLAEDHFGAQTKPEGIILTHGHFDHVGAIEELLEHWQVPVYAHELEIPYLTGKANYPEGDATVNGGLISELSPLFPNHGINIANHVKMLPADGSVPGLPEWKWLHTPGHTPGHISLFREKDRSLIVGDAFVTVKQESLYRVILQTQEISGPPKYSTTEWEAAAESVKKLNDLRPSLAVTGHGTPMRGEELTSQLAYLVDNFEKVAQPEEGRFVH
ncbi:MBL fold metallo-hydrolase [Paenibacillus aceris]|uniref:Glyoxylase-like metal-dependent hydrolase (Beta-lactamase superfamily II) n=1 Tax=Paenibacillus aceris TaxID=869555 RepID=A0ABS4HY79_9BACL|nr:MBL fold metallo-hydrolase [Paenibacillus aceris]MBP1963588.1 glyoxylase-like metal-dependent hydrolase (beta-lactamase superfamily II) [Paenibacillus aceris]NHW36850.1 MBL fold metallo-hydrolase [Paenibacillus aceris]